MNKPNIVFIMADQLSAKWLGCYGSGVPSTPALDELAESGMRYDRCYTTSPICSPNRASILTGRSPVIHSLVNNSYVLSPDTPTFVQVLSANGYHTGGFGKFHQSPMAFPVDNEEHYLGFDEGWVSEDPKWPWYEWVKKEHPEYAEKALAMCWGGWPCYPPPEDIDKHAAAQEKHNQPLRDASDWVHAYPSLLSPEVHDSTYITDLGINFIKEHTQSNPETPFFCNISYVDPHTPIDPPEPYSSMFSPDDMPDAIDAKWMEEGFTELFKWQKQTSCDEVYDKKDVVRKIRALYHGSLKYLDDQIARVIDHLKQNGLWENTIVVFTSDHGECLGDHGLFMKSYTHYDASIRCPLIVAGAGIVSGVSDRLTCALDFFPTFCEWAGLSGSDVPPLEGQALGSDGWNEVSVAFDTLESMVTDDNWRITLYRSDGKGQMFDLNNDPDELTNLYYDPSHQDKKVELLERLVHITNRPRTIPAYRNLPVHNGEKMDYELNKIYRLYQRPISNLLKEE